jgi:hypothetical protein
MTDVGLSGGAAPAVEPAPAPVQGEIPIQQHVDRPAPVDSPGPEKDRSASVRESVQRAFDRAGETKVTPKRGMGDNNPPEPMAKEKLDLKKPPEKDDRPRADHGHFAPRVNEKQGTDPQQSPGGVQTNDRPAQNSTTAALAQNGQRPPINPLPEYAPYREAPPRMADHAKAEWHRTPESVRGEVGRMHREMSEAYQKFKADHEEMNTIRNFQQMAREHGTTLQRAMTNYTTMERKLVSDPYGAFDMIVSNLNLRTPEGQKLTFRDLAYDYLSQSPEQHKLVQAQNAQSAQGYQLGALHQKVDAVANHLQQMQYQQAHSYTRSAVDQFADTHPRFDELGPAIEQEIQFGFDLETAYRRADAFHPATHAAQTRQTTPSAQTRQHDKSISGAPSSGLSDRQRGNGKTTATAREAVVNSVRAVLG